MEAECLRFSQIPHQNRLFVDYVENFSRVSKFYPPAAGEMGAIAERAKLVDYPAERRAAIADILESQNRSFGVAPEALENIARFRSGAAAVVTGQQVVLFGGPAFSFYKALTAIKLAKELEKSGTPATPIFWLATQDHDFAEVSQVTLRSGGELRSFAIARTGVEGAPVGSVKLDEKAAAVAREAAKFLGNTPSAKELARCYADGETVGSAFGKLFAALFGRLGLVLFDPADRAIGKVAAPVLAKAAELTPQLTNGLLARGRELESAGYEPQVKVTNSSTVLFSTVDGVRMPVRRVNGELAIGTRKLDASELKREIAAEPERFSGNALLRPVVQDFLLPTLAYVGGPAEVAYFAQAAIVYEQMLGRATPIVPRLSATVLDARDQRLLAQHHLSMLDMLKAGKELKEVLGMRNLPSELEAKFQHASGDVSESLEQLRSELKRLDPTVAEASQRSLSKMRYQLEKLRARAARALFCRKEELARHAAILENSLFPRHELQERVIAGISYLSQFGEQFFAPLIEAGRGGCKGHLVLPL